MFYNHSTLFVLFLLVTAAVPASGQVSGRVNVPSDGVWSGKPLITASVSSSQVRLTALALTRRIRLEIFSQTGEPVYDSDFRSGNRMEWEAKDQQGAVLRDGIYGCVVTVEDLDGQISHRQGLFRIKDGAMLFDTAHPNAAEVSDGQENVTILRAEYPSPFTLVSHDGKEGWIESASGGLSFFAGSQSRNRDTGPHLRLTAEGNLGIGVAEPQAKLDVAGLIRTSEGIQFGDGTVLRMQAGLPVLVRDSSRSALRSGSGSLQVISSEAPARPASEIVRVLAASGVAPGRLNSLEGDSPYYNTLYGLTAGQALTTGASNAFFGYAAGQANTKGNSNSFFGTSAGFANTEGIANSYFGANAGSSNTTGNSNSMFGWNAGAKSNGISNSFFGEQAGFWSQAGNFNSYFGQSAGFSNTSGNSNSIFGYFAGSSNSTGNNNTFMGAYADGAEGLTNATAIGYRAKVEQSNSLILGGVSGVNGATESTNVGMGTTSPSYRLHIYHNGTYPRIYIQGDSGRYPGFQLGFDTIGSKVALMRAVEQDTNGTQLQFYTRTDAAVMLQGMVINDVGNVGIGTATPQEKLHVIGNIRASGSITAFVTSPEEEVPDYVFAPGYKLMPVEELARYLEKEKHLPNVPPASEIKKNGVNLAEFQMRLLEKIEELTLYATQQEKTIRQKDAEVAALNSRLAALEQMMEQLTRQQQRK